MNIKTLAATALLAGTMTVVSAENLLSTVAFTPGSGSWSAPFAVVHTRAGSFTDTFDLGSFAQAVVAVSNLSTTNFGPHNNVDFVWARLSNGTTFVDYSLTAEDIFGDEFGDLAPSSFAAGQRLTLTVHGVAAGLLPAGSEVAASYSGNVNLAAVVPEPTTTALLLAGLAAVGWLTRRRLG